MPFELNLSSKSVLSKEHAILLDKIAYEIREDYVQFISKLLLGSDDELRFMLTPLISRNTLDCTLFEDLCRLELLKRIHIDSTLDSVRVNNPFFHSVIANILSKDVKVYTGKKMLYRVIEIAAKNMKILSFLAYNYTMRYISSWFLTSTVNALDKVPITIIDTLIYPSSFDKNNFVDRHFPNLMRYNREDENKSIYHMAYYYQVYDFVWLFRKIRHSGRTFLMPESYLKVSDYLAAFLSFTKLFRKFDGLVFRNCDVSALVTDAYYANLVNIGSSEGLLRYKLSHRLKEKGIRIKRVVHWYENQPINKGMILGLRTFYPEAYTVGHMGYFNSSNVVGTYPSKCDLRRQLLPDEVSVMGKELMKDIALFCPDLNVTISPALRFQKLLHSTVTQKATSEPMVLLALPIFTKDSYNILKLAGILRGHFPELRFIIKIHPGSNTRDLLAFIRKMEMENCLYQLNMHEAILSANLVLSGASSAVLESIFLGRRTIILSGCTGLLKNPIPAGISRDLYSICYDENELKHQVQCFIKDIKSGSKDRTELAIKHRNDHLELQTTKNTRDLLGLA